MKPHLLLLWAAGVAIWGPSIGCANLGKEARRSDGLIDFIPALAGHPRKDVVPVERCSGRAGEIVTAHAEADRAGSTYVSGILQQRVGYGGIYNAHIDVKVLGPDRGLVTALATDYFPRPVPNSYRGHTGRSSFSTQLPFIPTPGSTVQVAFHQVSLADCEFHQPGGVVRP